jgi:DNA-binding transcriptional LysR family regulator
VRAGVFASPRYLKRRGRPRSVADLANHECVLFRSSGARAVWELVGPAGPEKVEVHGAIGADDHHMISEAAGEGHGLALLPIFASCGRHAGAELTRVLPHHATVAVPLHLVYPSARLLPKRVVLLRDQLLEELPQLLNPLTTTRSR